MRTGEAGHGSSPKIKIQEHGHASVCVNVCLTMYVVVIHI